MQNGKRIGLPPLYVNKPVKGTHLTPFESPRIQEDYCANIYDNWNGSAALKPFAQMYKNMENGMVLAMSVWYDKETYVNGKPTGQQTGMSWLDGMNNFGRPTRA